MKKEVTIVDFSAERTGVSAKTGEQWYNRDVVVQWFEEGPNGTYEQQTVASINKRLNPVLLEKAKALGERIPVTLYFGYRVYDGNNGKAFYPQVKGYMPEEYELKEVE